VKRTDCCMSGESTPNGGHGIQLRRGPQGG
jgi:hypothetical protein